MRRRRRGRGRRLPTCSRVCDAASQSASQPPCMGERKALVARPLNNLQVRLLLLLHWVTTFSPVLPPVSQSASQPDRSRQRERESERDIERYLYIHVCIYISPCLENLNL